MFTEKCFLALCVSILLMEINSTEQATRQEWVDRLKSFTTNFTQLLLQLETGAPPEADQALSDLAGFSTTVSALADDISQNTDTAPSDVIKTTMGWTLILFDVTEVHSESNYQLKALGLDEALLKMMNDTVSAGVDVTQNSMLEEIIAEIDNVSTEIDTVNKKKKVKKCQKIQQLIGEGAVLLDDFLEIRAFLLVWKIWQIPFHFPEIRKFQTSIYSYIKCTLALQKLCKKGGFKKFKQKLTSAVSECITAVDKMITSAEQLKDKVISENSNPGSAFVIKLLIENGPENSFDVINDILAKL